MEVSQRVGQGRRASRVLVHTRHTRRVTVCPAPEKVNKDAHPTLLKDANSPLCQ